MKKLFFCLIASIVFSSISNAQSFDIVWSNFIDAEYNETTTKLHRTADATTDGGATSINKILPNQDGWVEMPALCRAFLGLSSPNNDPSRQSINYAIYPRGDALLYFENGISIQSLGAYDETDIVRVERAGSNIQVKKNGNILKTIPTDPSQELVADCSFNGNSFNSYIIDAKSSADAVVQNYEVSDISWTNLTNVSVTGSKVQKNLTQGARDAGASSAEIIPAGQNGWFEFIAGNISINRAIVGLSMSGNQAGLINMAYGIYLKDIMIYYEFGVARFSVGNYEAGDKIRFERTNNKLSIFKNGEFLYSTVINPNIDLMAEVAFYNAGWYTENVKYAVDTGVSLNQSTSPWKRGGNSNISYTQGNIGIRTTDIPTDYSLAIDGKAIMEEVKVQLKAEWPDYVFKDNYDLKSIDSLK